MKLYLILTSNPLLCKPPGGGGSPIYKLYTCVCATVKGMVFRQFRLGQGIEITQFWSRIRYKLPGKWPVYK